jgi:hypothetical protein
MTRSLEFRAGATWKRPLKVAWLLKPSAAPVVPFPARVLTWQSPGVLEAVLDKEAVAVAEPVRELLPVALPEGL